MTKKNLTLTTFAKFLNKRFRKKTGKPFTVSDVQGYVIRGHLPKYLGGHKILTSKEVEGVKLYNIEK